MSKWSGRVPGDPERVTGDAHRYPAEWPVISRRAKARAGWKCEGCGEANSRRGQADVLTVHHLDDWPEHSHDDNLIALCRACRLALQGMRAAAQGAPGTRAVAIERLAFRAACRRGQQVLPGYGALVADD